MFNVSTIEARIVTSDEEYNGKPFTYQYVGLFINGVQINDSIDWWDIVYLTYTGLMVLETPGI